MRHFAHNLWVWVSAIIFAIFTVVGLLLRFSGNIRNAIGIKKDLLETEKVEQELQEKRQRIQPATPNEIASYDPRTRSVIAAAEHEMHKILVPQSQVSSIRLHRWRWWTIVGLIVGLTVATILYLMRK